MMGTIDGADFRHLASGFNDPAQRVIDDRTGAATLGHHQILGRTHHVSQNRAKTAILPVIPRSHKAASNDEDLRIGHEKAREDTKTECATRLRERGTRFGRRRQQNPGLDQSPDGQAVPNRAQTCHEKAREDAKRMREKCHSLARTRYPHEKTITAASPTPSIARRGKQCRTA